MEVHPPDHPFHSWRDFFIHIVTITIGLLIALGIESAAEAVHHRHLLHHAEANLHAELSVNRQLIAKDERQLEVARTQFQTNLQLLISARNHAVPTAEPQFHWYWSGTQNAAWSAARETGAIALMPYEGAQTYSIVYGQQGVVDRQAEVYIADIYRIESPLQGGRKLADLQPSEIDTMIANTQQTLADIAHLHDLCNSLDTIYANTEHEF
jgi:hypothetical protein